MKILFAASEALPFIKVGGLGDVMGALPKELVKKGVDARVVIPMYSVMSQEMRDQCKFEKFFYFSLGWRSCYCGIFSAQANGVTYYLIDNEQYFKRGGTYGEFDDAERFAYFSKAVLEILPHIDFFPDIIHANDWHTALVPVYLDTQYRSLPGYGSIKTVFSIHNIEFQGKYDMSILESVFGIYPSQSSLVEFDGCLNLMKGAIECSNIVTTVSRTYAEEILNPYFSFGLHPILEARKYKLHGIVNGIDTDLFNPETDANIKAHYSVGDTEGKKADKAALQQEVGLPENPDVPVLGLVTRLTPQKGIDLFEPIMAELMEEDVQIVVLGNGFADYENYFKYCDYTYHDKFRAMIKFSASLAQRIYAGADIFLMPSKSEPCGLAQLIAMRYGTIPVVHAVGGLKDTVSPFNPETLEGSGVTFQSFNASDMLDAIRRAVAIWKDGKQREVIMKNAMSGDYTWTASAGEYIKLYESL